MNDPLTAYYAWLIMGGLVVAMVFCVVWLIFPFLVLGRLKRQQKTLEEIARNTKSRTD